VRKWGRREDLEGQDRASKKARSEPVLLEVSLSRGGERRGTPQLWQAGGSVSAGDELNTFGTARTHPDKMVNFSVAQVRNLSLPLSIQTSIDEHDLREGEEFKKT
jgi:hypothetical protein